MSRYPSALRPPPPVPPPPTEEEPAAPAAPVAAPLAAPARRRSLARRWQGRRRQGGALLAYRGLRWLLQRVGPLDFCIHSIIAAAPWRLRLPPRLPRGLEVRELTAADAAALERLRPPVGAGYLERWAEAHRCVGAFLDRRLVAFVWLRRGPAHLPASFGCRWQLAAPMAWIYDLYSNPEVVGAVPHLYGYLRQHPPGEACQRLVGQVDFQSPQSWRAHRSLGWEPQARLWSVRCGRWRLHLSHGGAGGRWRLHRGHALIPLHLLAADPGAAGEAAAGASAPEAARRRLQCECGRGLDGEARAEGQRFRCACGRELGRMQAGVAMMGTPIPYWGEVPQEQMQAVLARAAAVGWRAAVKELLPPDLSDYVAAEARADFQEVLPLAAGARVLDVGAGLGGIATVLARRYRVTALEGVAERAQFIALRRQQDRLQQLQVMGGDVLRTPLSPGQFDAIIVNGVLEWAAMLDVSAPPAAVQLVFLDRLRELLAPGGMIYLGIENRCGWSELRGAEDHSGLPYTSLLPRPLARWVCARSRSYRSRFNVGYRTYTYTHRGYADLFAQVGLRIETTWIAPSGYNAPDRMIPLHGGAIEFAQRAAAARATGASTAGWRGGVRQRMHHWGARPWIWRWFGSDFAFLLRAAEPSAGDQCGPMRGHHA